MGSFASISAKNKIYYYWSKGMQINSFKITKQRKKYKNYKSK